MKSPSLALKTATGALLLAFLLAMPTSRATALSNSFNEAPTMCFIHTITENVICWMRYKRMTIAIEYHPNLIFYVIYRP